MYWPTWAYNDLYVGTTPCPARNGYCSQGDKYAGSPNEVCGGDQGSWGHTDPEAWYPVEEGA